MGTGADRGPKRAEGTLELKLQMLVSHLIWVLGLNSVRPARAINHWAVSSASDYV